MTHRGSACAMQCATSAALKWNAFSARVTELGNARRLKNSPNNRRYQQTFMNTCSHHHLLLLPKKSHRLRCQHCHLTINANELNNRYCPECFEVSGKKKYDFQEVEESKTETIQYRCEDCGMLIDCG